MPDWITALILGVVEGLTEFVPVSSTGHLLLTKMLLGLPDGFWDTFTVLIQLGAILAMVALYFGRLWTVFVTLPTRPEARRFVASVLIAFLPGAVAGLLLHDVIKGVLFESPRLICGSLLMGGFVLLAVDRWAPAPRETNAMALPWLTALLVGAAQTLALIPGVSRSGGTIVASMLLRVEKRAAAEFSFFLAIPTMAGAFTLDLWKNRHALNTGQAGIITLGFAVSFVVGYIVVRKTLDFVSARGFAPFAWWRIVVGAGGLIWLATHGQGM
ncbi:MAG: undecaprenyl-diphosphatase [Phenylobacterium zucineum]|nr:MAG: undecaprenyl-diphosphatase [Phenylobacterium zucineum]